MDLKKTLLIILLLVLLLSIFLIPQQSPIKEIEKGTYFEPSILSASGSYGYVSFSSQGISNITLVALKVKPTSNIYVFDKSTGIGISNLGDFISSLISLENYNLKVEKINSLDSVPENSMLILAQGAFPYDDLSILSKNITILYIGKTDALLKQGIIQEDWYSGLNQEKKEKIVLYNTTLDDLYISNEIDGLLNSIILNEWNSESTQISTFYGGEGTIIIPIKEANYMRLIYPTLEGLKIKDSSKLPKSQNNLEFYSVFPSEKKSIYLPLADSKGIPTFNVYKDGKRISSDKLGTVGQDIFYKSISYDDPGNYIIKVTDYDGELASGIFHVKDLNISYDGFDGWFHIFKISLDHLPISDEKVTVGLEGSNNTLDLFVSQGVLKVPAKLQKGKNTLIITIYDRSYPIEINYDDKGSFDVYLQYGPLGLIFISALYLIILFTKKTPYRIKFHPAISLSSGELKISKKKIQSILPKAISEFGSNGCITPREFSLALRKYVTNGNDVLDGNAEALLKKFKKSNYLECYKSFYKIKDKENVKKTVLDRLIREKLIEEGISFKYKSGVFNTKEQSIIYAKENSTIKGKLIVVFESSSAVSSYLNSQKPKTKSRTALKIRNGSLLLLSINELAEYL